MKNLAEKYVVIGTGISGIAACNLLQKRGLQVVLFDGNDQLDMVAFKSKNPSLSDVEMYVGSLPEAVLKSVTCAVLSPGVPTDIPLVEEMRARGIKISGEIQLAYEMGRGAVVAITGTNGKTTTTALTGEIMRRHFTDVRVVGNIGIPYTKEAETMTEETVTVAEISSFQLETISSFAPHVSAILNITPDHLNRHHTMENYIQAKEDITKFQGSEDVTVLNYEDEVLRAFGETLHHKVIYFSSRRELADGLFYEDGVIYWNRDGKKEEILPVDQLQILGLHNYENVMAAVAMADAMGVTMDEIRDALRAFTAVEHRIEYVCEKRGIRFYNDSKGTNPDAAIKGILAMDRKTCLIGGGYDKQSTYDEWIESFGDKVKLLVLIGQTREKIAECCKNHNFNDYVFADTFEEAIDKCYAAAESGDAILLSPACASWGMFPNYEERGRIFKDYVRNLAE
ncbi:MAG: UDP-N-acetylmuramoyl-L-alanine--D-glutamate ligase [Lachnospiraceae bacterium]|nr:UDP-N-acetylmuramoyl-L-alanine--D-glutamate ligase [Lachnospiraceae bacterium]